MIIPPKKEQHPFCWHQLDVEQIIKKLEGTRRGLREDEVIERQKKWGMNELPRDNPPSKIFIFIRQFKSPLIYILIVASGLSAIVGEIPDAVFILIVVLFNALIGGFEEYRSEMSAASLQKLLKQKTRVRRAGKIEVIDALEIVPGDIVFLESGENVTADLRILNEYNLSIDESLLTGESMPVDKVSLALPENKLPLGDMKNLAFAGSKVITGRGEGIAIATGLGTQVGKISRAVSQEMSAKPPLTLRMESFVHHLTIIITLVMLLLIGVSTLKGDPFYEVFILCVALAVSAIPEGLPVAITVALSVAVKRMTKRNVIIRKLRAVEGLGSCTIIATDKTGTLTINKQTAKILSLHQKNSFIRAELNTDSLTYLSKPHKQLIKVGAICNEAYIKEDKEKTRILGDAIDVTLLELGQNWGFGPWHLKEKIKYLEKIPYESEKKFAAQFYIEDQVHKVAVKGACEKVLEFCNKKISHKKILNEEKLLAARGLRVLAFAEGELAQGLETKHPEEKHVAHLNFLGFIGFIDPLRKESKEAVERCLKAGVKVAMITGDHPQTALAIAKEAGIAHQQGQLLTGSDLEKIKSQKNVQEELKNHIAKTRVFARVNPLHKALIVETLQELGHFVAVTGDGVNDAPAMRKSNIPVAMGSGSDVARETAAIIVTDDNFASIEAGIEEGRFAYDNVRKVIFLLITTGASEVILFLGAVSMGLPLPLSAVQLLWLNLVTNGIQDIALAFEKGEEGVMERPPRRPDEPIFDQLFIQETLVSGLTMGGIALLSWWWLQNQNYSIPLSRNYLLLLMVLFENFHAFNSRSEKKSTFTLPLKNNLILVTSVPLALGLHLTATHLPLMQKILEVQSITLVEFFILFFLASTVLIASEFFKLWKSHA